MNDEFPEEGLWVLLVIFGLYLINAIDGAIYLWNQSY